MLIDLFLILFLLFSILLLISGLIHLGYGVPYVPTPQSTVDKMVKLADLKKGDKVFDLGCGDGRLIFTAEKITKTPGTGYELAPIIYIIAQIKRFTKNSKADIRMESLFKSDLSQADVLFCYLMPHMLKKLTKKILKECRPGTKIISHGFKIEGLIPKKSFKHPTIHLYEIE